jgi:site-specific DNA recombinase
MSLRVAIYCRISDDREGSGLGVARQEEDCRALAGKRGWSVEQVFVDNDISAYSGRIRPSYRLLLTAMKNKEIDAVIAWHTDRLHRSPKELEEFISICETSNIHIETVQAGYIDLTTPSGRMVARMLGTAARFESEHKSERIKRKSREYALQGKIWSYGKNRAFGFEYGNVKVVESEAKIIQDLAERFLAGETLTSLGRWLNENGIRTTMGNEWRRSGVRRILYNARWSGQREHLGEIVAKAEWPAILTPEQTRQIRQILDNPARRTSTAARRNLLVGLVVCKRCGSKMVGGPTKNGSRRYFCRRGISSVACGRTFIKAEPLEQFVVAAVLERLDNKSVTSALSRRSSGDRTTASLEAEMSSAKSRLNELAEMFGLGEISRAQFMASQKVTQKKLADAERIFGNLTQSSVLTGHIGNGQLLATKWNQLNLDRQRAIVKTVLGSLEVGVKTTRPGTFDYSRLKPIWRL